MGDSEVRETIESAQFQASLRYIAHDFQRVLQDPKKRSEALRLGYETREAATVLGVANFFESASTFIKRGMLDRDIACDLWGYSVLRNWELLEPFITN